jgi:hypothetical protein
LHLDISEKKRQGGEILVDFKLLSLIFILVVVIKRDYEMFRPK